VPRRFSFSLLVAAPSAAFAPAAAPPSAVTDVAA